MRILCVAIFLITISSVQAQDPDRDRDLSDKELIRALQRREADLSLQIARLKSESSSAEAEKATAVREKVSAQTVVSIIEAWIPLGIVVVFILLGLAFYLGRRYEGRRRTKVPKVWHS